MLVQNVGPDLGLNCLQRLSVKTKVAASKKRELFEGFH